MIDPEDDRLLVLLQRGLPLLRRPLEHVAQAIGASEEQVQVRIRQLRQSGIIREISGIFDAGALGYKQALVAFDVPAANLDAAGSAVSLHPGVSHCYARDGRYNLWFTLAVHPQSGLGVEGTVRRLAGQARASRHMILPTIKRYKLRVEFGQDLRANVDEPVTQPADRPALALTPEQSAAVGLMQIDMPDSVQPFDVLAQAGNLQVDQLLSLAEELTRMGMMRRYAAVLNHTQAGARANVLVAWQVHPGQEDLAGKQCAALHAISHCYLRPQMPDWPYTLYTMIHGRSRSECKLTIEEIAAVTALGGRCELWTMTQYKKKRMALLDGQQLEWERT